MCTSRGGLFFAICILVPSAFGTVHHVPQQYPTIQAAINAARAGDTVLVGEGTFTENLLITRNIVLASLFLIDGDTAHVSRTIIDGSAPTHPDAGSSVTYAAGTDTSSILTGFTVRGGSGSKASFNGYDWSTGGGILCVGGATIVRNIIADNRVTRNMPAGAGFASLPDAPYFILRSNIITHNVTLGSGYSEAAGLCIRSSGEITNNLIAYNDAYGRDGAAGGGMYCWLAGDVRLINNTIVYNEAYGGTEGVQTYGATTYLVNNIIWNPGDGIDFGVDAANVFASHNLIRGSFYGDRNINTDPAFQNTTTYELSSASPCVSNGVDTVILNGHLFVAPSNDIYGRVRPSTPTGSPDLGAVESTFDVAIPFSQDPQMFNRTLIAATLQRRYVIFLPKNYEIAGKLPLLLFFHGSGGNSERYMSAGFNTIAEREGFIVVYPNSYGPSWNYDPSSIDVVFVQTLLDSVKARYPVDTTRIFISGKSAGALFCFWLASYMGDQLAAIGPIANTIPKALSAIPKPIPMIQFMGTADQSVSYYGSSTRYSAEEGAGFWAGLNGCSLSPTVEDLPDSETTDGCTVQRISYQKGGGALAPVQLYKIVGGGHSIPGPQMWFTAPVCRDINAPELIWKFFVDMTTTSVAESEQSLPGRYSVSQNYPNPFNPSTTIKYELPKSSEVRVSVFDLLGREVSVLVNERRDAGVHGVKFDGSSLASGMYLYRLRAGDFVQTRKMLFVR